MTSDNMDMGALSDSELPAEFLENSNSTGDGDGEDGDDAEALERILISQQFIYLVPLLKILAVLHTLVSISMLIAYCALKVSDELHVDDILCAQG